MAAGTNGHPRDEAFRMPGYLTLLVNLGIRHFRGEWAPSFIDSRGNDYRHFWIPIHQRNQTIAVGGTTPGTQPIFASLLPAGSKNYWAFTYRTHDTMNANDPNNYNPAIPQPTVDEVFQAMEGGQQHRQPGWKVLVPNGTTSSQTADTPNPWNIADPEFPWDLVSGLQGQNEYGTGGGVGAGQEFPNAVQSAKSHHSEFFSKAKTRIATPCYGSLRSHPVVFDTGIGVNPTVAQLPTVGPSFVNAGHSITSGDWTADPTVAPYTDFGDAHPYHPGLEPNHRWYDENVTGVFNGMTTGCYNGNLRNPPDRTKALPFWHTEIGYIDSGFAAVTDVNHGGYWPAPGDINAEYFVRDALMLYWRGVRRMFQYFFWDSGTDPNNAEHHFGLVFNNGTPKPAYYALRNLFSLVTFSEASQAAKRAIPFTISGFTAQGANYNSGTNTMIARSDGINKHRAMFGTGSGGSWLDTTDAIEPVLLQQTDNVYVLALPRHVMLWDREPGNWNLAQNQFGMLANVAGGTYSPAPQTITVTFPEGVSEVREATPTATGNSYEDGRTWSAPKTISNGTSVTVSIAGKTKLLKVTTGQAPAGTVFTPGIVTGTSPEDGNAIVSLGAKVARVEFDIQTAPSAMNSVIDFFATRGARVLPLAGFDSYIPTTGQAQNLANWANAFGPGGTFWAGRTDGALAVTQIEFGNETSFGYQFGDNPGDASYNQRAKDYANRFVSAADSITATGKAVGLLCQTDDAGSGNPAWVDNMYVAQPSLHNKVAGWTVHPYGPTYLNKTTRCCVTATGNHGAPNTIPIDITEIGVSTDNGTNTGDNYGWSTTMTYAQAATTMGGAGGIVPTLRADPAVGPRLRHLMLYQIHDQQPGGQVNHREYYFGALKLGGAEKGNYSTAVRTILASGASATQATPVVVPSVGATPATLRQGSPTGARLHLQGVCVWGLPDDITNNVTVSGTAFHQNQYANRVAIAQTVKSWGANLVRLRILGDDYNAAPSADTDSLTKAQIIQRVKDWRDAVVGQGMYFMVCGWDALDGANNGANWNSANYHQMYSDIYASLGSDPHVIYEPTNEPNNVSFGNGNGSGVWDANTRATILYFRETIGYKGLLVLDPINWANSGTGGAGYSDSVYSNIEAYDAARLGMGGAHQIAWAKHDYANEYAGSAWSASAWQTGAGGAQIKHLIFESEFGNYNGPGTTNDVWASNAAAFFQGRFAAQQNFVGAVPFLFGPWSDANAMTTADNATTTTWGTTVKNTYLA